MDLRQRTVEGLQTAKLEGKIIVLVPNDKIDEYLKFANEDIVIRNNK